MVWKWPCAGALDPLKPELLSKCQSVNKGNEERQNSEDKYDA